MIVTRPALAPTPDDPGPAVPGRLDAGRDGVLDASVAAGWLPRLPIDRWSGELAVIRRADLDRLRAHLGVPDVQPLDTWAEVARWPHLVDAARACPLVPVGPAAARDARDAGARLYRLTWVPSDGVVMLSAEGGDQPEVGWELDGDDLLDEEDAGHLLDRALRALTAGALTEAAVSLAAQLPPAGAPVDVDWFERADRIVAARVAAADAGAADRFGEVMAGFRRPGAEDPRPVDLPDRMLRVRRREGNGWRAEAVLLPATRVWIAPEVHAPTPITAHAPPPTEARGCEPPPPRPMSNGRTMGALFAFAGFSGLAALAPLPRLVHGAAVAAAIAAGAAFAAEISRGYKRR